MAKTLQLRRYTTSNLASITGASGELIVDTTLNTITVHNGSKAGGFYAANAITLQAAYNQVNAAYTQANSASLYGNGAFIQANSAYSSQNITGSYANSAFLVANTPPAIANSAALYANGAFVQANASFTQANSAYTQANSVYLPSTTRLDVTADGSVAFYFDQYTENNATLYVTAGETVAFNLNVTGHPFLIRVSSSNTLYNIGLTHVTTTGVITTDANAQGQITGTLYWKIPNVLADNTYVYQCQNHPGMVGNIVIGSPNQSNLAFAQANTAANTVPQNRQTTNYVLQLSDAGKHLYYETGSNVTIYIPTTANVAFANGNKIMVVSRTSSSANITLAPNTGVSLFAAGNTISGNHNVTTYGVATLMQVAANTWFIQGTGLL